MAKSFFFWLAAWVQLIRVINVLKKRGHLTTTKTKTKNIYTTLFFLISLFVGLVVLLYIFSVYRRQWEKKVSLFSNHYYLCVFLLFLFFFFIDLKQLILYNMTTTKTTTANLSSSFLFIFHFSISHQ